MANFKDLNSLLQAVKKQVQDVANSEVKKTIKNTMQKHIDSDVYDVFEPTMYDRRDMNGGLIADENINIDVVPNNNGVNITATDVAKANGDDYGDLLTPFIEEGIYDWSHQPPPRKFIEKTTEDLEENQLIEKALRDGLKKRGINTK